MQATDKTDSYSAPSGKKVILVTYPEEFVRNEAIGLVEAAGYRIVEVLNQKNLNHQQYGVGTGKAEELRDIAEEKKTEMIIIDERLSSGQAHNLAKFCHQQVIDRERLILDIFNERATTAEAKLQVKLAELKYEIPRAREAVRISLKGEQAGFMGMGEYAVDIKFRALKRQMVLIQKKLDDARRRRQLFKTSRDFPSYPSQATPAVEKLLCSTDLFRKVRKNPRSSLRRLPRPREALSRQLARKYYYQIRSDSSVDCRLTWLKPSNQHLKSSPMPTLFCLFWTRASRCPTFRLSIKAAGKF
jgi:GTP-binding GTPase N-terminal/GTP-binding GTPase Middle Region